MGSSSSPPWLCLSTAMVVSLHRHGAVASSLWCRCLITMVSLPHHYGVVVSSLWCRCLITMVSLPHHYGAVSSSLWCCFLAAPAVSLHRPWWQLPVAIGAAVHAARGGGAAPSRLPWRALFLPRKPRGGCIPGAGGACLTGVCFMACRPGRLGEGSPQGRESAGEGELHGHAEVLRHGGVTAAGEQGLGALAVIVEREGDHAAHGIVNLHARLDGHVAAGGLA